MKPIRLIIAGGRDFTDQSIAVKSLGEMFPDTDKDDVEIVSGGARGADKVGELIAESNNISLKLFPADWDTYGRSAGFRRNVDMAEYSTHLLAFWDGKSGGTKHMINIATERNLIVNVVKY